MGIQLWGGILLSIVKFDVMTTATDNVTHVSPQIWHHTYEIDIHSTPHPKSKVPKQTSPKHMVKISKPAKTHLSLTTCLIPCQRLWSPNQILTEICNAHSHCHVHIFWEILYSETIQNHPPHSWTHCARVISGNVWKSQQCPAMSEFGAQLSNGGCATLHKPWLHWIFEWLQGTFRTEALWRCDLRKSS